MERTEKGENAEWGGAASAVPATCRLGSVER